MSSDGDYSASGDDHDTDGYSGAEEVDYDTDGGEQLQGDGSTVR